jgi:hypothetical protein
VPANEDASRGSRLKQLLAMWAEAGRIDMGGPKCQKEIAVLTSSANPAVKATIQALSTRITMLVDVSGRVSPMKRDLAAIMRTYMTTASKCQDK